MYLEVKDVRKSYGSDAGYTQVLKGVTTSVEKRRNVRNTGNERFGQIDAP